MTGQQKLVWLITGCSSGLGATLAEYLLTVRRDKVIATARNPSKLSHLNTLGADILALDLTARQSELTSIIERAIAAYGRIDVLVNNASFIQIGTWEDLSIEDLRSQFETNVFGTVKVTKALLPHFRTQKAGTMVFISSLSGWIGHASCGAYAGSKFALEGLVESLHTETQHLGIKTLIIEPGRFRTNLLSPGNMKAALSSIPEYAELNTGLMQHLAEQDQAQPGDPQKLVELIVDLVRGEGMAEGRKEPFRLPVGADCVDEIKDKCEQMLNTLDGWNDIIRSTDFQADL